MTLDTKACTLWGVIVSFADKDTQTVWQTERARRLPPDVQERALRKLIQLHAAQSLEDLRSPPSNHLEKLRGDRAGQYSIRINQQWSLCFHWQGDGLVANVEIVDYH